MAANKVLYASASLATEQGRRGRTPAIWKGFPFLQIFEDPSIGSFIWEDFLTLSGTAVASNSGNYSGAGSAWHTFEDTSGSVKQAATDFPTGPAGVLTAQGVVKLLTPATAHKAITMELGGSANGGGFGGAFGVGSAAAATVPSVNSLPKLFFEARVRFVQSTVQSAFIGLCTPGKTASANLLFSSADVYTKPIAALGFQVDGATSTSVINGIYGTATATTTVGSGAVPSTLTNWTKLGFVIDPFDVQPVKFFQDGVLLGSSTLSGLTAANWPSNLAMTPTFCIQAQGAGGAAVELDIDWIATGQMTNVE